MSDEVQLFDHLIVKYEYPLQPEILVLGPPHLCDPNYNILEKYNIYDIDEKLKHKTENVSWNFHSTLKSTTWKENFRDIENFHKKLKKESESDPQKLKCRIFWPLWHDLLGKKLGLSINNTYLYHCDNNPKILEQAIHGLIVSRPKYCFILLDSWVKFDLLGEKIDLKGYDLHSEEQKNLLDNLVGLKKDYAKFTSTLCRPTLDKIAIIYELAQKIGTHVFLAQSCHPFEDIAFSHPQLWYMFQHSLNLVFNKMPINDGNINERLHVIGWPFDPEQGGELVVPNTLETTVPYCYNFPNDKGHVYIAEKFMSKVEEIQQRL